MRSPELDKAKHQTKSCTPRVWPPGHIQAAETRPKLRFRGFVREVGGVFAPPIFVRSSPLGFAYKSELFRDHRERQCRDRF